MKKTMNLVRQNHKKPNSEKLHTMRKDLEELIDYEFQSQQEWDDVIREIIRFQNEDGSFNLLDSYRIESDCRVFYCHEPTYICSALLIKALLKDKEVFCGKEETILSKALYMCCARGLKGHGYDGMSGQLKAISYFMKCNIKEFLSQYPDICIEFSDMFQQIKELYARYVKEESYYGAWGESYKDKMIEVYHYFYPTVVFVYGTLMKGQSNHHRYLANSSYIGDATLSSYDIYDLGHYPGIVEGEGRVYGELYEINSDDLKQMDILEDEGDLYLRKLVQVSLDNGECRDAWCYIYHHSIDGHPQIFSRYGQEEMVWYVAYGSNLLEERLRYYMEGGYCIYNDRNYRGCNDKTLFVETRPIMIPYDMYYANYDKGSWEHSAVSFLDVSHSGCAYGRAYKIKKSQLNDIHVQEGRSSNWYPSMMQLEDIDGISAYTFVNHQVKQKEPFSRVSAKYGYVLLKGMKETYPGLSDDEIFTYLNQCGNK